MFNSLKYTKILEKSGIDRKQAESHIQVLSEVLGEEMATRQDIYDLNQKAENRYNFTDRRFNVIEEKFDRRCDAIEEKFDKRCDAIEEKFDKRCDAIEEKLDRRCDAIEEKFDQRFHRLEQDFANLRVEFHQMEHRLILKLGGFIAALWAASVGLATVFFS